MKNTPLPALRDYPAFDSHLKTLADLRAQLAQTREQINNTGVGRFGAESHADKHLDETVAAIEHAIERDRKAKLRLELKAEAIERAIALLDEQTAELHRQAVEFVGAAAHERHAEIVKRLLALREEHSSLMRAEFGVREQLRVSINEPLEGHLCLDLGERFARPVPHFYGN